MDVVHTLEFIRVCAEKSWTINHLNVICWMKKTVGSLVIKLNVHCRRRRWMRMAKVCFVIILFLLFVVLYKAFIVEIIDRNIRNFYKLPFVCKLFDLMAAHLGPLPNLFFNDRW